MIHKIEIEKLEQSLKDTKRILSEKKKEFAIQECPHKIGDKVEVNCFAHKGKFIIVETISYPKYDFQGDWIVSGKVLKKDGSKGERIGERSDRQW